MALTLSHDLTTKTIVENSEIQDNFDDVTNKFSGGIVDGDINASANIGLAKLAGRYQYQQVRLSATTLAATGYSSSGEPVYGTSGDGVWTVKGITWVTSDMGTETATIQVEWGEWDATLGTWSATTTFGPYTVTSGAPNNTGQAVSPVSGGSSTLAFGTVPRCLRLNVTGLDAAATADIQVMVTLRRDIQAA